MPVIVSQATQLRNARIAARHKVWCLLRTHGRYATIGGVLVTDILAAFDALKSPEVY